MAGNNEFVARNGMIIYGVNSGSTSDQVVVLNTATNKLETRTNAGSSGTSGTSGTDGSSGTSGSNGTDGSSGTSGTSGTDGSSGTSGSNGTDGSSGTSGSNGTDGSSGTSGSNGTDGSSGTSGSNGTDGSSGTSGSNGTDGSSGTSGSNGTDGSSGTSGTSGSSTLLYGTSGNSISLPPIATGIAITGTDLGTSPATVCQATPGVERFTSTGEIFTGLVLYTDSALTTPQTGFTYVANDNDGAIFNLNSVTGLIGTRTLFSC